MYPTASGSYAESIDGEGELQEDDNGPKTGRARLRGDRELFWRTFGHGSRLPR